jgi:S-formylglutathione hydrolase FrmB
MSTFRTIEISDPRFERDGLRCITFKSPALRGRADVTLFVPESAPADLPVVLLLHGVYGSHWAWALKGGAHVTARRLIEGGEIPPLALAMPSDGLWGDGSGYVRHRSHASRGDYERFIVDEVPEAARQACAAITSASPLLIGGLSMGGFGAMRLGATYGRARFAGISAHSSATELASLVARAVEEPLEAFGAIPREEGSALAAILAGRETLPPLRFDCGTEDHLIEDNRSLHRELLAQGVPHVYEEFAGGHEWPYWEAHLADSLRFFARDCLAAPTARANI